MPMICLDCRYVNSRPSGIGRLVEALIDQLPSLAPDWQFTFLRAASRQEQLSTASNVTELAVSAHPNGPLSMWALPQLVDLSAIDLYHAPANILPRGIEAPCVTTIHDLMWLDHPEWCNAKPWGRIERLFFGHGMRRAVRKSDAIQTVSEATRDAIVARYPHLADKTFATLSGVSNSFRPQPVERADLARLGITAEGFVLTVGQFAPYKNHEGAIRAFDAAFADRASIDLVLVQRRNAGSQALHELVRELGLTDRVHIMPPLDQRDLVMLYNGALALLHPSFCEGYGMPLAEAMACGCPVITSDRSAMPEVTGEGAILVDPCDTAAIAAALVRVVDEPGLGASMRKHGLERAGQLDWKSFVRGTLDVYRKVLSER